MHYRTADHFQNYVSKSMEGTRWTLVQKKTNQRLQTDHGFRVDTVETLTTQQDDSKLYNCESSVSGVSETQSAVLEDCAHITSVEQTNINSLIGTPFIMRSQQEVEQKLDENPKGTRKLKSDELRQPSSSVRGILRINPNKLNNGKGVTSDGQEVEDMSEMNEVDWPSISGCVTLKEGHHENVADSERDSKSWSTVLRTVTLPQSIKKGKSSAKSVDHSEGEGKGDKKLTAKKKQKKENGHSSAATERRRDQPLLLEFESLFESLQVQGSKKVVTSSGGAPRLLTKPATKADTQHKEISRGGNILDSSAPSTRRGKEREIPKKKRPSALRKVITSEKEKRKAGEADVDIESTFPGTEGATVIKDRAKPTIHNRRFREYCNHLVKEEINTCVEHFLADLARFQDRMYLKDPIKAKAKRRYVCGLREVLKHLKLKKLKCVILPPNLDRIQSEGGINDIIGQILDICMEQQLFVVFAMSRRRLALVLKKRHKVGCVGIFSYDGAEMHYKQLMTLVETARDEYEAKIAAMDTDNKPQGEIVSLQEESPKGDLVEADVPSGSSCESSDSEVEDVTSQQHIMSSPWKIFFEQSNKDESVKPNDSIPLNVNATEFTPSFKFNLDAKEFVPVYFCDQ